MDVCFILFLSNDKCVFYIYSGLRSFSESHSQVCSALSSLVKSLFMPLDLEIIAENGSIKEKSLKNVDDLANNPMDLLITFEFLNNYSIVYLKINIFKYIGFFSVPINELAFSIFPRIISMLSSKWLVLKANLTLSQHTTILSIAHIFILKEYFGVRT